MRNLAVIIFFIVSLVSFSPAQFPTVVFTGGNGSRNGYNHIQPSSGLVFRFRFLNANSDVNGGVDANSTTNPSEIVTSCCYYGRSFSFNDQTGSENYMHRLDEPVIVNGTTYNEFYYKGAIKFTGSVRVPFYLRKKQTQILNFPITVTGVIRGYATFSDIGNNNPVFITPLNMNGTAAVTIRPHDDFQPNHFDIVSVQYNFTP